MKATKQQVPEGPETRFGAVRGYFKDHVGVKHYMPVFVALDSDLADHAVKIQQWWNSRSAVTTEDLPVIERMERVVEVLKNAKAVA